MTPVETQLFKAVDRLARTVQLLTEGGIQDSMLGGVFDYLQAALDADAVSSPSPDNKEPATRPCAANSGTPEPRFEVGDRVQIITGPSTGEKGTVLGVDRDVVDIRMDIGADYFRPMCVLENLSRKEQA